jgi:hypothetical protein
MPPQFVVRFFERLEALALLVEGGHALRIAQAGALCHAGGWCLVGVYPD